MGIMKRLFGRNGEEQALDETAQPEEGAEGWPGSARDSGVMPGSQAPSNVRQYSPHPSPDHADTPDASDLPPTPPAPPSDAPPVAEPMQPISPVSAGAPGVVEESAAPTPDTTTAPEEATAAGEGTPPRDSVTPETPVVDGATTAAVIEQQETPVVEELGTGTLVAGRYQVVGILTAEQATTLLGAPLAPTEAQLYAVEDTRGYERCWSCGSTANAAQQRFCVDCGAQLQHHQLVLARTKTATGEADEFGEAGAFYHLVLPRKQFGSDGITLEMGAYSLEGPHQPNEDSYWTASAGGAYNSSSQMVGVAVLADGMGGYAPGSGLISREVVTIAGRHTFMALLESLADDSSESALQAVVREAILQANRAVLAEAATRGEMGSTFVMAVCHGATAYLANIGDSRAYYIAPSGAVSQITRDQSLVEAQITAGLLSPEDAYTVMGNNVILHAMGEEGVEDVFDWYVQPLEPGGRLLLCSDGYWKTMRHDVWNPEAAQHQTTLAGLARALAEEALARNTDDNTTVVLIAIS
jgi:serine/threonine protein phosphatase PrpC